MIADCERALGRPERALSIAASPEVGKLPVDQRVEMLIVESGARADLGQLEAAVITLQLGLLDNRSGAPWVARLRSAYADALAAVGRDAEARHWLERAAEADPDDVTGVHERLAELDGIVLTDLEDEDATTDRRRRKGRRERTRSRRWRAAMTAGAEAVVVLAASPPPVRVHDVALLDLDGVVYVGPDAVPGAADAIARAAGSACVRCTSPTMRPGLPRRWPNTCVNWACPPTPPTSSLRAARGRDPRRHAAGRGRRPRRGRRGARGRAGGRRAAARSQAGRRPTGAGEVRPSSRGSPRPSAGPTWRRVPVRSDRAFRGWRPTSTCTVPTPHGPAPGNGALVDAVAAAAGRRPDEVAGKPEARAFSGAAAAGRQRAPPGRGGPARHGPRGRTRVGHPRPAGADRHHRRHRAPGAPAHTRPDLVGRDLGALLTITPRRRRAPTAPGGAAGRSSASRAAPSRSTRRVATPWTCCGPPARQSGRRRDGGRRTQDRSSRRSAGSNPAPAGRASVAA